MKIVLSPVASNRTTIVSVSGLVVTIDGQDIDLSVIPEGGQGDADIESPLIGKVTRESLSIRYEYDSNAAVENQSTDWADYTFEVTEGEVPCPIKWR